MSPSLSPTPSRGPRGLPRPGGLARWPPRSSGPSPGPVTPATAGDRPRPNASARPRPASAPPSPGRSAAPGCSTRCPRARPAEGAAPPDRGRARGARSGRPLRPLPLERGRPPRRPEEPPDPAQPRTRSRRARARRSPSASWPVPTRPARVFRAGASYYRYGGDKVPLPFDNDTGRHAVFLKAYEKYVARLATWSRKHDVRLLHLSQYGQDWAELNHGSEVRAARGYTERRWLRAPPPADRHRRPAELGQASPSSCRSPVTARSPRASRPSSGVQGDQDRRQEQPAVLRPGQRLGRVPASGARPPRAVEGDFDADLAQARHARSPDDPARRLPTGAGSSTGSTRTHATYAEVYLPSFWQVPGPDRLSSTTTPGARIAQLERQIQAFRHRTC